MQLTLDRRTVNVAVLALGLALTGCSDAAPEQAADLLDPSLAGAVTSTAPPSPDRADIDAVMRMEARASMAVRDRLAACMTDRGHDQLRQAESRRARTSPSGPTYAPLRTHPLELGPTTTAEADRYGLLGVEDAFIPPPPPPAVVSRSTAYDEALADCEAGNAGWVNRARGASAAALDLANRVRRTFLARTAVQVDALLRDRLRCVRDTAYPDLRPLRWTRDANTRDLLADLGVTFVQSDMHTPVPPEVKDGDVVVVAQPPRSRYRPTTSERRFARTYARCGVEGDFVRRLEALQVSARAAITADHRDELIDTHDQLAELLASAR